MTSHKHIATCLLSLVILLIIALGCGAVSDGRPAAEKAIVQFHAMLDNEQYADIYTGLDPEFKKLATEEEALKLFQAVHMKLGKVTSSTNQTWKANATPFGTTVEMVQDTQFERGKGAEDFVFFYANKKVSLAGYHINSMDMLTK